MAGEMPVVLPPGMVAEQLTVEVRGKTTTVTVYRAPFQVEGPARFKDPAGTPLLAFRYASFVFVWRQGRATVDVSHGTLGGTGNMAMFRNVPIDGEWSEFRLAEFGTRWARDRLARGRPNGLTPRFPVA